MHDNYNRSHGVRTLHPLAIGDRVRIKTDKEKTRSDGMTLELLSKPITQVALMW